MAAPGHRLVVHAPATQREGQTSLRSRCPVKNIRFNRESRGRNGKVGPLGARMFLDLQCSAAFLDRSNDVTANLPTDLSSELSSPPSPGDEFQIQRGKEWHPQTSPLLMAPRERLLLLLVTLIVPIAASEGRIVGEKGFRLHTLFSTECQNYFDWQTVGLLHSFRKAGQPGPITRLLSCTDDERRRYRGMDLAPTMMVPSMSRHPRTGDWYPAINKPAGVLHWLQHSEDANNTDWVVILDADMIIRGPIIPWEIGAEKGQPVSALYGYLIGCNNILAKLHTKHPELCDMVGGLLAMHIDDLRALAPLWLSKTEEVREDREHWATNITGDIYGKGWISEMYGYSFGAAEVGLRHKITENLMIYPGYVPLAGVEPILMHYGLPFKVGNWSFGKLKFHDDAIVYECNRLFPNPPYPREVQMMEKDPNKKRGLFLSLECMNTLNEALLLHHESAGCPKPKMSKYLSFLKSKTFSDLVKPVYLSGHEKGRNKTERKETTLSRTGSVHPKIHTVFSTECSSYFDWQTLGLMYSYRLSGQPGGITRLLSCTDEQLKNYKGHDLAPTHYAPSMSKHPLTGDWYPAINKPAAVLHWLNHAKIDAEFIVILDADMILRGPITPWEFNAERGRPVSTPYEYLIGCDNELAKIHTRHPEACDKVGGVIIMHIDDLRQFALLWLHKTEEVRADKSRYGTNYTGDIYSSGWISEMYGYSFGAAEMNLKHTINRNIMIYPGYVPVSGVDYKVLHYGLEFGVGDWSFDKANWREKDVVNTCWAKFPDPPDPLSLPKEDGDSYRKDLLSIECVQKLNRALFLHHQRTCKDQETEKISNQRPENLQEQARKGLEEMKEGEKKERVILPSSRLSKISSGKSQRSWLVGIWAFLVMSFMVSITISLSRHRWDGSRGKADKAKV